jgi:hypothetical protein
MASWLHRSTGDAGQACRSSRRDAGSRSPGRPPSAVAASLAASPAPGPSHRTASTRVCLLGVVAGPGAGPGTGGRTAAAWSSGARWSCCGCHGRVSLGGWEHAGAALGGHVRHQRTPAWWSRCRLGCADYAAFQCDGRSWPGCAGAHCCQHAGQVASHAYRGAVHGDHFGPALRAAPARRRMAQAGLAAPVATLVQVELAGSLQVVADAVDRLRADITDLGDDGAVRLGWVGGEQFGHCGVDLGAACPADVSRRPAPGACRVGTWPWSRQQYHRASQAHALHHYCRPSAVLALRWNPSSGLR